MLLSVLWARSDRGVLNRDDCCDRRLGARRPGPAASGSPVIRAALARFADARTGTAQDLATHLKVVEKYGPTRIALLEAVDSLLLTFTEEDVRHVIRDARHEDYLPDESAWWWNRIPTTGPVAEHARTFPDGGFILEDIPGPGDDE